MLVKNETQVGVIEGYREYTKVNKYLAGLIKVSRLSYIEKIGQEVHIRVPEEISEHDKFYINGIEFKSVSKKG